MPAGRHKRFGQRQKKYFPHKIHFVTKVLNHKSKLSEQNAKSFVYGNECSDNMWRRNAWMPWKCSTINKSRLLLVINCTLPPSNSYGEKKKRWKAIKHYGQIKIKGTKRFTVPTVYSGGEAKPSEKSENKKTKNQKTISVQTKKNTNFLALNGFFFVGP